MIWRCRFLFSVALVLAPTSAWAITSSVPSAADTFVLPLHSTNNYGGAGGFAVSASVQPNGQILSLLRFDMASTLSAFDQAYGSGNWTLDGASLQLTATSPGNQIFNPSAAGQIAAQWLPLDVWGEGTGTPNNPTNVGILYSLLPVFLIDGQELGQFAFDGSVSGTATYDLIISSGFRADVQTGNLLSILLSPGDATVSGVFNSRDFNRGVNSPRLILSAVQIPEPATTALAGIAIIGSLVLRPRFLQSH